MEDSSGIKFTRREFLITSATSVAATSMPSALAAATSPEGAAVMAKVSLQVNGKTRGTIQVPPDVTQDGALAAAMAQESIAKFVTVDPGRVIFVKGRLLNIVTS